MGAEIDPVELIAAADAQIVNVRTQGKDYSFNELLSMHEDGELIINPEYQRLFRWSVEKESRFIESLLLELPLPPIFVIEDEQGKYELIDGLQRISSYLHFRGKLDALHRNLHVGDYLVLAECDILAALNGCTYDSLPEALKIKLKRHSVRVEVIRKESDKRLRYHMFKRLNTGGTLLSEQEIRNCTIRLLDNRFNEFLIARSKDRAFVDCISAVSSADKEKKFDQELVLRFFAMKNWRDNFVHEIGSFMTEYLEAVTEGRVVFNYDVEETVFQKTFAILSACFQDDPFYMVVLRSSGKQSRYSFSVLHFEAFTLGLQLYLDQLRPDDVEQMESLQELLKGLKEDVNFIGKTTGGGKNSKGSLGQRVEAVSDRIRGWI